MEPRQQKFAGQSNRGEGAAQKESSTDLPHSCLQLRTGQAMSVSKLCEAGEEPPKKEQETKHPELTQHSELFVLLLGIGAKFLAKFYQMESKYI